MARPSWRRLVQWIVLAFASCGLGQPAAAHPHVRISVEVVFVVEQGAVTLVKHRWTFDEDFRRSNLLEFDKNENGILEEDELAAFQQRALETLKRFDSFTVAWRGTAKVPLKEPVLVRFDMQAARPVYEFDVALSTPIPLTDAGALFDVYDPTYYSAFDFRSERTLSIQAEEGANCSATLIAPARGSTQMKDYRAFVAEFGPLAAKLVTPRSIKLTCPPSALR